MKEADTKYKQVIIIRNDLKLPKGKMASQAAHASVEAVLKTSKEIIKLWRNEGMKKITLKVDNLRDIYKLNQRAKDVGIATAIISDAGRTVVEPGTVTCLAIGPSEENQIDSITGDLKMM